MEWTTDVAAGEWVRERLNDGFAGDMHDVVPRGFPAYARIFHPATRERPVGLPWPPQPYATNARAWDAFARSQPEIDAERVSWADAARAFGRTMHPLAQWHVISGGAPEEERPEDADGWRYAAPPAGELAADLVTIVAAHLAAGTTTPGAGCIALWEGWGGLIGHMGHEPSRTFLSSSPEGTGDVPADAALRDRHDAMLRRSIRDRFNNVFRKPTWQPGILPDEISNGPRLRLPGRDHVLFRGGIAELTDPDWETRASWRDLAAEEHGFPPSAQSPNLVWPDDRAWVLVTEIDFDSTVVGGSPELVRELCADRRLEAHPLPEGADLTGDDALAR